MNVTVKSKGKFDKASKYLKRLEEDPFDMNIIKDGAEKGLIALIDATPIDTGKTRDCWYYEIERDDGLVKIKFCNSNVADFVPIAIILQYGHATGTGGWVEGIDYINPAIRPVFEDIVNKIWKEVTG